MNTFGRDVVFFPVWWYTRGASQLGALVIREIRSLIDALNLRILARFLFKPMFGYTDWQSRIISLYVRIGHFCILLVISLIVASLWITGFIAWLIFPLFVVYNILFHLGLISHVFNIYA